MACHLYYTKPLSEQMYVFIISNMPLNMVQLIFSQNQDILFILELLSVIYLPFLSNERRVDFNLIKSLSKINWYKDTMPRFLISAGALEHTKSMIKFSQDFLIFKYVWVNMTPCTIYNETKQ